MIRTPGKVSEVSPALKGGPPDWLQETPRVPGEVGGRGQKRQTEAPVTIRDPLVTGLQAREDSPPRAAVPPLQKHGVPLAAPGEAGLSCSKILADHFQGDAKATASIKTDKAPLLRHQMWKRKSPRLLSYRVNLHLTRAQWLPQGTETSTRWPSGQLQDSSEAGNRAGCGMQGGGGGGHSGGT